MNSKKTTLFFVTISIILVLTVIHATNIFYSSLNDQKKELKLIEIKKGMGLSEISLLLYSYKKKLLIIVIYLISKL